MYRKIHILFSNFDQYANLRPEVDTHLNVRDAIPVGVLHQIPGLLSGHDPVLDDHLAVALARVVVASSLLTFGQLFQVVDVDGLGLLAPAGVLEVAVVEQGLHTPRHDAAATVALPPPMPLQF